MRVKTAIKRFNSWNLPTKISLVLAFVSILMGIFLGGSHLNQIHLGSGDNVVGDKITTYNNGDLAEIKEVNHILVKLTYKEPVLFHEDTCSNGVCAGEYIVIGESADDVRVDPKKCTEFQPTSYHYDIGPYDPETGHYTKLISDWSGKEVRICGWFDLPKSQVLSRENILYQGSIEKNVDNYNTYRSDGSIIVQ